ncbi:hypothetical protein RchiOBHm_Chr2g0086871 [Rosa chinensis]|uniref:Uncharacterized protein n=1 Tax=Rosa chinensis TaxID=74649 RepID=A0A2P6RIJ2_ROSCH|nr:hypothetical protein RchiOBHm_Chr2g0086871 [Rosa chinensis]
MVDCAARFDWHGVGGWIGNLSLRKKKRLRETRRVGRKQKTKKVRGRRRD